MSSFAYQQIAGLPIVAYFGMATLTLFLATAVVGFLNFRGNTKVPFKWHPRLAATALALAAIHTVLALSAYLNF